MAEFSVWHVTATAGISAITSAVVSLAVAKLNTGPIERRTAQVQRRNLIEQLIEELSEKSCLYWRTDGVQKEIAQEITKGFHNLFHRLDAFRDNARKTDGHGEVAMLVEALNTSVTGGSFQTAARVADTVKATILRGEFERLNHNVTSLSLAARKKKWHKQLLK